PSIPVELEAICVRAMARAPALRYLTARELREDLARFLAGEAPRARPLGAISRLARRLRPYRHELIVSGLVVVAVLLGAWAFRNRSLADARDHSGSTPTPALLQVK